MTTPFTAQLLETPVTYHEDASSLFSYLGGTTADDAVLLESADVSNKHSVNSLMVLTGSVRVTCRGSKVTATPLTDSGRCIVERLTQQLTDYVSATDTGDGSVTYCFPVSEAADERERLTAPSPILPLRLLQSNPGYTHKTGELPLVAGGFAYDFLETFETLPPVPTRHNTYPDYQFLVAETVLAIDHRTQSARLAAVAVGDHGTQVHDTVNRLAEAINSAEIPAAPLPQAGESTVIAEASMTDAQFREHVVALKHHIAVGDIYQAMPSRYFTLECPDAFRAYRALRETNPSPYMFYVRGLIDGKGYELFGASPESNLKFTAATRQVELYPVAGTLPRGMNPDGSINDELDIRAELQLRTDAKEIAEHTMLVDLARNDVARVAVPATHRVADLMMVDRYSRVMHLVSRVTAELAPDLDGLDAYRACMNMGTLTGAPKLKASELNRVVEGCRRGSYGGAVGYLRGNGDMDTCIVIRSGFVTDGTAVVQAGAGVVRDSNPQSEADESLHKAYAVLHAIAVAAGKKLEVKR